MWNPQMEDGLTTEEDVKTAIEMVRADKNLTAQDRKNTLRRLNRKLGKVTVLPVKPPQKSVSTDFMDDVILALGDLLLKEDERILHNVPGMAYAEANIVEAKDYLKADAAAMAGTLMKNFKKKWATDPRWFTTIQNGTQVLLVLGPVPEKMSF